ncbi:UNVERIFIED_ORG: putative aminopeptidase [Rhodococcus erythropolis]
MTDAFAFTPDADFVDRTLEAELRESNAAVDRRLRTMLAALDDALAGISDAREELHTLYAAPSAGNSGDTAAHDQALSTRLYLAHAESDLRAAAAILRSQRQLTVRP